MGRLRSSAIAVAFSQRIPRTTKGSELRPAAELPKLPLPVLDPGFLALLCARGALLLDQHSKRCKLSRDGRPEPTAQGDPHNLIR